VAHQFVQKQNANDSTTQMVGRWRRSRRGAAKI
jgi:hypothetical protein